MQWLLEGSSLAGPSTAQVRLPRSFHCSKLATKEVRLNYFPVLVGRMVKFI